MASNFGQDTIKKAASYWLEHIPYTAVIKNLAAGGSESLFAVRNWNPPADSAGIYVELSAIGVSPWPGAQLVIRADRTQLRYDLATWPDNLVRVPIGAGAFDQLSVSINNPTGTAIPALYVSYVVTVWRDPLAQKLLYGKRLTARDQAILKMVGKNLTPAQFIIQGRAPRNREDLIQTTVDNRQIAPSRPYALMTTIQAGKQTTLPAYLAQANQLLILRSIAVGANPEDGVTVTVDRDSDPGHVVVDAYPGDVDHPIEAFVPATSTLTVHLSATQVPTAAIPVQLGIQRIAISDVWQVRLRQMTVQDLAQELGSTAAADQAFSRVEAGVL